MGTLLKSKKNLRRAPTMRMKMRRKRTTRRRRVNPRAKSPRRRKNDCGLSYPVG
jgi:hypothetical protein